MSMETPMEATPRPWSVERCNRWKRACYIRSESGLRIGYTYSDIQKMHRGEPEANAALIVRAVNAHDDLVRALEDAERTLAHAYAREGWESLSESLAVARAALQKARA